MTKFLLLFVVLAVLTTCVVTVSEEMKELAAALHNTCQKEANVSEELIERARKGDFQEDQSLKCYMKCLMDQMAVIDDKGIIDVDAVWELLPDEFKSPEVEAGLRHCGTQIGKDPCDNAFLTNKCYYDQKPEKYFLV